MTVLRTPTRARFVAAARFAVHRRPSASFSLLVARGRDFLRIDFYEVERPPWFDEYCLYPGSGYDRFAADWIDEELGALWLAAAK